MNMLAEELNAILRETSVYELLSAMGKRFYFPRGIVAQTAEAKQHAHYINATVGMAFEKASPLHLQPIKDYLPDLKPEDIFTYSTTAGESGLRELWKAEMIKKNPELRQMPFSLPIVVSGITHGLLVAADLFVDKGDQLILPDLFWGNYRLIFENRHQANLSTYPLFTEQGAFNIAGLESTIREQAQKSENGKVIILLNFPNNPTGYSPTQEEVERIVRALEGLAEEGVKMIAITDDAYFGLFFEEETYTQSLFAPLGSLHKNIIAVKADGATKEELAWGFRIGFLTFANPDLADPHYEALNKKVMGLVRSSTSNANRLAQYLLQRGIKSSSHAAEKQKTYRIIKEKYLKVRSILSEWPAGGALTPMPFNSGYFMCFRTGGSAEKLRQKLLHEKGIGTIAVDDRTLRIAYSITDTANLTELYTTVYKTAQALF